MYSVFEVFKIGVGPSSSHTVGPMKAAFQFLTDLRAMDRLSDITRVEVDVHGSLSLTGKGHHTDVAIVMGLAGNLPESVDIDAIPTFMEAVAQSGQLPLGKEGHRVSFPAEAITFHEDTLPLHENGMAIHAYQGERLVHTKTYYSIGGGAVVDAERFGQPETELKPQPYAFTDAAELLEQCAETGMSISALMLENEKAYHDKAVIDAKCQQVWSVMLEAIERGCNTEGVLAGPLKVPRRAAALKRQLEAGARHDTDPMAIIDWVNMFALAASEENAAGGRVVTAPTNGAAGIIPAVMAYYDKFIEPVGPQQQRAFYLTAGAIGVLYKMNASISGAEVGCQGEVGVACSMAAAGLAELMGASPSQVCIAAEIAMEHHLGLTCDPVAGQVQVPCIERNAIAAVKAINATRMALRRNSAPRVSLDKVIATMYETGKDMHPKYRETSRGGLAIKVLNVC